MDTKGFSPKLMSKNILHSKKVVSKRPPVFPRRLYDMLESAQALGYSHIISWMPDGKSFKIHDEKAVVEVLKTYFKQTRLKSFLRQLQLYGFARICKGPHRGECKHELFVRGKRDLIHLRALDDFKVTPSVLSTIARRVSTDSANLDLCTSLERSIEDERPKQTTWPLIPTKLSNLVIYAAKRVNIARNDTFSMDKISSSGNEIISGPANQANQNVVPIQLVDDNGALDDNDGTDSVEEEAEFVTASAAPSDNLTDEYSMITLVKGDILSSMTVHPIEDSSLSFFEKHFIYDYLTEDKC